VLGHFDNQKEANLLASRMDARLSDLSIRIEGLENVKVSASVGHVVFDSVPDSISMMLQSADKSMYSAKKENKSSSSYVLS
jgi:GGDEF domain-containing protein